MMALKEHIADHGLSQSEAAKPFGVTQPRISGLMRGKINLFSLDALIDMDPVSWIRTAHCPAVWCASHG